ncbi:Sel1-repeat containing protein [Gracilaria domingensis]|nr:Sel1-repeat containing protein [Gracilaria domingensis]
MDDYSDASENRESSSQESGSENVEEEEEEEEEETGLYRPSISNLNFRENEQDGTPRPRQFTEAALASLRQRAQQEDPESMAALADFVVSFGQHSPSELTHAMYLYLRAWELGHSLRASQMTSLADILTSGGLTIDSSGSYASQLYQLAIREGYIRAIHNYGVLCLHGGPGFESNLSQAVQLFVTAAENGHERALVNLGILIEGDAQMTGIRMADVARLFEQAEEHGNEHVLNGLACLLLAGQDGVQRDIPRAVRLFERAIDSGSTFAMRHLAALLGIGSEDIPADMPRAVELYGRAVENDDALSAELLGRILVDGTNDVQADPTRAVELFRMAIDNGSISARSSLAQLLADGADGVQANPAEAVKLLEEAVEQGNDTTSMMKLGLLLVDGADGVPKNPERGMDLLERAAAEEDVDAILVFALVLASGSEDIPPNPIRAVRLLERATGMGSVDALLWHAKILFFGENINADPVRSVSLLERAVAEGHYEAMEFLASILCDGADGVPPDPHRAVRLYEKAIEDGKIDTSLVELGVLYYKGAQEFPRDPARAFRLFEEAAGKLNVVGMCNLAVMLVVGLDGIPKDKRRAIELYEKAIDIESSAMAKAYLSMLLWVEDQDLPRAVQLCTEAVQEDHIPAFPALANFLRIGCTSLEKDTMRAIFLCERASLDENEETHLLVLANLFTEGENSEHLDGHGAVRAFERLISMEKDMSKLVWVKCSLRQSRTNLPFRGWSHGVLPESEVVLNPKTLAVLNYASLLIDGMAGVPRDSSRAVELYKRAVEEDKSVLAMVNLGYLLCNPALAVGVAPDGQEGIRLLEMAISIDNNATAMLVLADYLVDELNHDNKNPHRAAELYRAVIRATNDPQAFINLHNLLLAGADGFPPDPESAQRLLREAAECDVVINERT